MIVLIFGIEIGWKGNLFAGIAKGAASYAKTWSDSDISKQI